MVIEVEGEYHIDPQQQQEDQWRTEYLERKGYKVIRFTNEEVNSDVKGVISKIKEELINIEDNYDAERSGLTYLTVENHDNEDILSSSHIDISVIDENKTNNAYDKAFAFVSAHFDEVYLYEDIMNNNPQNLISRESVDIENN